MGDISDVNDALVSFITSAIYPNGVNGGSAVILNGSPVDGRVFSGWPNPQMLDADMGATPPIFSVSVFPQAGNERVTTRFTRRWHDLPATPPTITATVSNGAITIGGAITAGHYVTVHAGNKPASYAAAANDTLATFATALAAALTTAGVASSASGPTITVPAAFRDRLTIRTAAPGRSVCEVSRSDQRYHITIWAPNNAVRAAVAKIVKPALDTIDTLPLPDNFTAWIRLESSSDVDRAGKANLSCRDLYYWVEYPTTIGMVGYPITTFVSKIEQDSNTTHITPLPLANFTPEATAIS